jgi:hypothetical protein
VSKLKRKAWVVGIRGHGDIRDFYIDGICENCGRLLSIADNCFIVTNKAYLKEALEGFLCFDCYRIQKLIEDGECNCCTDWKCLHSEGYEFEEKWWFPFWRFLKWMYPFKEDCTFLCIEFVDPEGDSPFACACPVFS